jgi:CubicO group peptidase (beta-lactamase class C family)
MCRRIDGMLTCRRIDGMLTYRWLAACLTLALAAAAHAQPYDFSEADALLTAELPALSGHVAVIVRQDGADVYRFQAGDIGYDTLTRMASFTKTISAGVVLSLVDAGLLSLDLRLGDALPLFEMNGLGDPTVLDAWAMRHGIDAPVAYEHDPRWTLAESVARIGVTGFLVFSPPGSQLGYDGKGMQSVGRIAEIVTGQAWETIARDRILDPCGMPQTDYGQFAPNPAVAGGLRSTPEESIGYAEMIIDRGWCGGARVLSDAAIEQLFANATRELPVYYEPWPLFHPLYPYGERPDYAFGAWVLAEHPQTQHVEEIVGAGAWGSYLWIDRRRGTTAVLFTDIPPGSLGSMDAALGLFDVVRRQVEAAQVGSLQAAPAGPQVMLGFEPAPGSIATRIRGASAPLRDVYDLRDATLLAEVTGDSAVVPRFAHYAATAVYAPLENTALVPGGNSVAGPAQAVPAAPAWAIVAAGLLLLVRARSVLRSRRP